MDNAGKKKLWLGIGITAVIILSCLGAYAFIQNLGSNNSKVLDDAISVPTYEQIAPLVQEHLEKQGALNEDGTINVPNTGGEVDVFMMEAAIQNLLKDGRLDYLKGYQGERGETGSSGADGVAGAQGAQGPAGQDGASGVVTVGSGLNLSGGTLTLATCAVDQVLMVDGGANWACATVATSGVDTNTTNTSAALSLVGTTLTSTITDSDGNTVTGNSLDLGANFATDTEVADAISALNIAQYATTTDLNSLTSRVVTLETNAQNYITSSQLTDTLGDYATEQWVTSQDFLIGSDLNGYATEQWVDDQNFVYNSALTSALGDYYTKSQIDEMNLVHGATQGYTIQIVDALPATPDPNVIYFVKGQ